MSQVAHKIVPPIIHARHQNQVVGAKPVDGRHSEQIENAFKIAFARYHKAFEELAKV